MAHTPTPWKMVSSLNFDSGLTYVSVQPVDADDERDKALKMMNGEYHVCRMSHSAAPWRIALHQANAAFIVEAVNSHDALIEERDRLRAAMQEAIDLLLERKHGNPARSHAHNARVTLQFALTGDVVSPATAIRESGREM